ncbi:MAG: rhodanese-like domain-containing protein, partial [Deltaproteobacteria bacterium]
DGGQAESVAREIIKAGYGRVIVLTGGFAGWQSAGYDVANGKMLAKATYTPKLMPGEINLDEFKKYAVDLPSNVMIIDARSIAEGKAGMLKSAKQIPAEDIKEHLAEIQKDKLIIFYCNTGVIAEVAYNTLKELGYANVKFVNAKMEFEKNGSYKITKD